MNAKKQSEDKKDQRLGWSMLVVAVILLLVVFVKWREIF
jgi:hypothetical protein